MGKKRNRRIAYLCDLSPELDWSYSGGNQRIYNALQENVGDVVVLPQSWGLAEPLRRLLHRLPEAVNLRLRWRLHLMLGWLVAGPVNKALRQGDFDLVFCAYSLHSMAGLKLPDHTRLVFTADATPSVYKSSEVGQSFGSYLSLSRLFDGFVRRREGRLLAACDLLLWPSDWQDQGAAKMFPGLESKSNVVPWGANITAPEKPAVKQLPSDGRPVEFLFVGRDWEAKGGPFVVETLELLQSRGVAVRLTVIGCEPPVSAPFMEVHPSLDKANKTENETFLECFARAHLMFMASFEAYGFAFCEAAAYGLPSICLSSGGVPVIDGKTGFTLPVGATVGNFADLIEKLLDEPNDYKAISTGSRQYFESTLNWESWAKTSDRLIKKLSENPPV